MSCSESVDAVQADELAQSIEATASLAIVPATVIMAICYSVLAICHLYFLGPPFSFVMAGVSLASCIVSIFIGSQYSKFCMRVRAHDVLGVLGIVILANVTIHLCLVPDKLQTTYFAIAIVGVGFIMLDQTWFAATACLYFATWLVAFRSLPASPTDQHFYFLMVVASGFAVAAHVARRRSTIQAETARISSEKRRIRMEAKLWAQHEQQAHLSNIMTMGELVSGVANELSQPLAAISNRVATCQLMKGDSFAEPMFAEQLEQIQLSIDFAGAIIARLRKLSAVRSTERVDMSINQVILDTLDLLAPTIRNEKIQLQIDLADKLPTVCANDLQIRQVIINMIRNGVEAIRNESTACLTIRTAELDGGVRVSVLDSGPGLRDKDPRELFDAFVTTKDDGIGVGLAICRTIVEQHGGRIWCNTLFPDNVHRTAFHFSLPVPSRREQNNDQYGLSS